MGDAALEVDVRTDGPRADVRVIGELDLATLGILQTSVEGLARAVRRITLDLTDLEFIDSSAIATILGLHRRLDAEDRDLVLRNPQPIVRRVLEMTGAQELLTIE